MDSLFHAINQVATELGNNGSKTIFLLTDEISNTSNPVRSMRVKRVTSEAYEALE
jgi:hypothetical protein